MSKTDDPKLSGKGEVDLNAIVLQINNGLYDARKMCSETKQIAIKGAEYEEYFSSDWGDPCEEHDYSHINAYGTLMEIQTRLDKLNHELWKIGIRLDLLHNLL